MTKGAAGLRGGSSPEQQRNSGRPEVHVKGHLASVGCQKQPLPPGRKVVSASSVSSRMELRVAPGSSSPVSARLAEKLTMARSPCCRPRSATTCGESRTQPRQLVRLLLGGGNGQVALLQAAVRHDLQRVRRDSKRQVYATWA